MRRDEFVPSEWDRLAMEMRGESAGAGAEWCTKCGLRYYDPIHLANPDRQCKRKKPAPVKSP